MTTTLDGKTYAYFDDSDDHFIFTRPVNRLYISVESGSVGLSLDGGDNFMSLPVGLHELNVYIYQIYFSGAGTFSGFGVSL